MTHDQVNAAMVAIEPPEGEGWKGRVHLSSGEWFDGALRAPQKGILRVESWITEDGDNSTYVAIDIDSIVAIERI
jgi:hypothetical protein